MDNYNQAWAFLQTLVNQPLCYAVKSPDMELYCFGFGKKVEVTNWMGVKEKVCTHTLHVLCRFEIVRRISLKYVKRYYEDTPSYEFYSDINPLLGLSVKRIALSDKNDLWIDLGDYWIVFATFEDGQESWRFFEGHKETPHLVASNSWIDF